MALTDPRPDPPTRTAKLVYNGVFGSTPWTNVMWLYLTGSGEIDNSEQTELAGDAHAAYADHLMTFRSASCSLETTQLVLYADGGPFEVTVSDPTAGGDSTSGLLPAQVAMCISWKIAAHYRGGHPRTYLAGFSTLAAASITSWTGSIVTSADSAAAAFHAELEGITTSGSGVDTVEHGIVSFQSGGDWRATPVFRRINGHAVDTRLDTQRRRLGPDRPA